MRNVLLMRCNVFMQSRPPDGGVSRGGACHPPTPEPKFSVDVPVLLMNPLNVPLFTRSKQKCTSKSTSKVTKHIKKKTVLCLVLLLFKEQVNK